MEYIEKAELFFILPINRIIELNNNTIDDDFFLKKLIEVQKDEFSERLVNQTTRRRLYEGEISFCAYTFACTIYANNFHLYSSSLVYFVIHLDKRMLISDFANLINSKNVIFKTKLDGIDTYSILMQLGIDQNEIEDIFLFCQIIDLFPVFPKQYEEGIAYIQSYKQNFHQILLRSDTRHDHLRPDNHSSNFDSISNFYGTIDMCSPVTLLQLYQHPIESICENKNVYDLPHRACWWLVITDVLFIQKSVLSDTLNTMNLVQSRDKKKTIKAMSQIEKVLLNMQEYWYFEDYSHEITKKVVNIVKEKMGITSTLESVMARVESLQNTVLREVNEEQNEYNFFLNIILLIIALIQIVPLVYQILSTITLSPNEISWQNIATWIKSFTISITFPLIIWIIRSINRKRFSKNMMILKESQRR